MWKECKKNDLQVVKIKFNGITLYFFFQKIKIVFHISELRKCYLVEVSFTISEKTVGLKGHRYFWRDVFILAVQSKQMMDQYNPLS